MWLLRAELVGTDASRIEGGARGWRLIAVGAGAAERRVGRLTETVGRSWAKEPIDQAVRRANCEDAWLFRRRGA